MSPGRERLAARLVDEIRTFTFPERAERRPGAYSTSFAGFPVESASAYLTAADAGIVST